MVEIKKESHTGFPSKKEMIEMESQTRKPTEEEKKVFDEADKKLDKVMSDGRSKISMKKKIFMKISDVDPEDAAWLKSFADRHTDGKQFLAIKLLRFIAEKEPLYNAVLDHEERLARLESQPVEEPKLKIPKTQGGKK